MILQIVKGLVIKILIKWITTVKYVINFSNLGANIIIMNQTHKESDKCKHMEIPNENTDINNVDEVFYAYIIQR